LQPSTNRKPMGFREDKFARTREAVSNLSLGDRTNDGRAPGLQKRRGKTALRQRQANTQQRLYFLAGAEN